MAAAEYFSSAPMTGQQQQQQSSPYEMSGAHQRPPTSNPAGNSYNGRNSSSQIPQIQTHAPPAYTATAQSNNPGVHFAPTPSNNHQHSPSTSHQSPNLRPYNPQTQNSYQSSQPLPIRQSRPQNPAYPQYASAGHTPPMQYGTSPYANTPPQGQHLMPYVRPNANPHASQLSLDSGFSSDPEQQRRRRKNHHRHRDDNGSSRDMERDRTTRPRSRSAKTDAWVGAAGGGLIGDLIFPGLGTLGGAAIGWLGGREYGKREEKLHEAQKDWEKKFRPNQHKHNSSRSRSRDREHNSRGSSQLGERRGSHDSRRSHH